MTQTTTESFVPIVVAALFLAFFAIITNARAAPAEPAAGPVAAQPGALGLSVSGASSGINTEYFEQAALEALTASGIFSSVDNSHTANVVVPMIRANSVFPGVNTVESTPYVLKIRVIRVEAPSFSVRMTVSMNVVWSLRRTDNNETLLHEVIHSSYTGGMFEGGFIGANRVRAGTEGATRENIRAGLAMLKALSLDRGHDTRIRSATTDRAAAPAGRR